MSTSDKSAELENARRLHAESERLVSSLDSLRSHLLAVEQIAERISLFLYFMDRNCQNNACVEQCGSSRHGRWQPRDPSSCSSLKQNKSLGFFLYDFR